MRRAILRVLVDAFDVDDHLPGFIIVTIIVGTKFDAEQTRSIFVEDAER